MSDYYNEINFSAVAWLRELMRRGFIAPGFIDTRPIQEVEPYDLRGFTQCHFFAGIGVWSYSARRAGWPADRPLWTGSCPCQPFSVTGKRQGFNDHRDLWPDFHRLIRSCRPAEVMGEQVTGTAGYDWFDRVTANLAAEDYSCRGVDIPACAVNAPHQRNRIYWCAVADSDDDRDCGRGLPRETGRAALEVDGRGERGLRADVGKRNEHGCLNVANREGGGRGEGLSERVVLGDEFYSATESNAPIDVGDGDGAGSSFREGESDDARSQRAAAQRTDDSPVWTFYLEHEWIVCHDGKVRRAKPGTPMLVNGFAGRVPMWRALGNAIQSGLAQEVVRAYLETDGLASRSLAPRATDLGSLKDENYAARRALTDVVRNA